MKSLLRTVFEVLNTPIFGGETVRKARHPYFGEIIRFGFKDQSKDYWEAELEDPVTGGKIGIGMDGSPDGPDPGEVAFCREALGDLDALFAKCREAFAAEYPNWTDKPFPDHWRDAFALDGMTVPNDGDPTKPWDVCYFVDPAGHYFTAEFRDGSVAAVSVDG